MATDRPHPPDRAADATEAADTARRTCGGCNVCCTAMRVTPLDKPPDTPCVHQNGAGCSIYERRPSVCRAWYCMWVRDDGRVFSDHHRPDRLGVFFTASQPDPQTGRQTVYAHEVEPYATQTPEPDHVISQLRRHVPVRIVPARRRRHHDAPPPRA